MGKIEERITSDELSVALYAYVEDSFSESSTKYSNDEKEAMRADYDRYLDSFCTGSKTTAIKIKNMTYQMLAELLYLSHISLQEAFALVGAKIEWPDERHTQICNICDSMDEKKRILIMDSAISISAPFWQTEEVKAMKPTSKLLMIIDRMYFASSVNENRPPLSAEISRIRNNRVGTTRMDTLLFPETANQLSLPLHWLMGFADYRNCHPLVLAKHPETELIMDAYDFMPPISKEAFWQAINPVRAD